MDILVVSDSHFLEKNLIDLVDYYKDKVNMIIHCGDSQLLNTNDVWQHVDYAVRGNCDISTEYPKDKVFIANATTCFLTHGHYYDVNYGLHELSREAKMLGCQIAFYGHTHVMNAEKVDDVICINPGSLNNGRGKYANYKTFAIVHIDDHIIEVNFYDEEHNCLTHLRKKFHKKG